MLQRILTLKYLGFSLQKIEESMASRSIEQQLSEQKELLVQKKRLRELHEIVEAFDARIEVPSQGITKRFQLENALPQLQPFLAQIERMDQENDLIVDDIEAIYDYVASYPGNAACILEQRGEEFRRQLRERMDQEGAIFIHKSTGMFRCHI